MRVKYDFLNWRPDMDKTAYDGLDVAVNMIHTREGWVCARSPSAGSFATSTPLGSIASHTSIRAKPFGVNDDLAVALIQKLTVTTSSLHIGVNGNAAFTGVTLPTLISIGAARISSFAIAELGQDVVISANANCSLASGGSTLISVGGTFSYTVTSL